MLDFRKRIREAYDIIVSRNFIRDVSTELTGRWNFMIFLLFIHIITKNYVLKEKINLLSTQIRDIILRILKMKYNISNKKENRFKKWRLNIIFLWLTLITWYFIN